MSAPARIFVTLLFALLSVAPLGRAQESELRRDAERALRRGIEFFRRDVAVHGTYLWQYSDDLSKREGEGVASATRGWIQPPGTPGVGMAILAAYRATGDRAYLDAARETGEGLLRGQLRSGGWTYFVDFDPKERKKLAYRVDGSVKGRNVTTLDDDTTTAALRFLMQLDRALDFKDAEIHEAVAFAWENLLRAQYPNGAWPQGYHEFPDPAKFPVERASLPGSWPRTWPGSKEYWLRYTVNDGVLSNMVEALLEASEIYKEAGAAGKSLADECRKAAERSGKFLILAQLPEPQPAWAQQYDFDMQPSWARKFEPPAVTGGESQSAISTLLVLYRETGDKKYLEPIPRALEYLRRSRLTDGRLARFYELKTNRPLYFTRDYQLTYDDGDSPKHYAFKVGDKTESIAREYEKLKAMSDEERRRSLLRRDVENSQSAEMEANVRAMIKAQDDRGRWVENGRLAHHGKDDPTTRVIRCATFIRNVETLSRYLAALREKTAVPPPLTEYKGRQIAQTMHYLGAPWLVRDEREREERASVMLKALGVKPGQTVCDLGCGNGFHTVKLAEMVGREGRVLAVDIQPEMLRMLEVKAKEADVRNIEPILGLPHDAKLPEGKIDLILLVDVYHEFSHPEHMLRLMRRALKPDGRIALVEFRSEDPKVPIKPEHKMSKEQILKEFPPNGLKLAEQFDKLPWQHLMFFARDEAWKEN
jgi:ubiquinone/menaquinone biosynthesis C-methylase UbiE